MHVCGSQEEGASPYKLEKEMICPRCGCEDAVYVHGHTQCVDCHLVIEECCQGEVCGVQTPPPDGEASDELS
jgi:hypothetical protein